MGLNSWNLEGFPENKQPEVTLESLGLDRSSEPTEQPKQPENENNAPEAIVNVDTTNPGERTLNDSEIEQIPQWAVKINLIEEKGSKLVDMLEVRKDIEGDEAMSLPQAEVINATFENFITASRPLASFSKSSSNIGLADSLKFMHDRVRVTAESLQEELEAYKSTQAPELRTVTQSLRDDGIYDAFCVIREACNEISKHAPFFDGKTIIVPVDDGAFFNVLTESLITLDSTKIDPKIPLSQETRDALETLKTLWSNSDLMRNIVSIATIHASGNQNQVTESLTGLNLTVCDILKIFASERSDEMYENMANFTQDLKETTDEALDGLAAKNEDPYREANMIVTQAQAVGQAASQTLKANSALQDVAKFAKACSCFICGLVNL